MYMEINNILSLCVGSVGILAFVLAELRRYHHGAKKEADMYSRIAAIEVDQTRLRDEIKRTTAQIMREIDGIRTANKESMIEMKESIKEIREGQIMVIEKIGELSGKISQITN